MNETIGQSTNQLITVSLCRCVQHACVGGLAVLHRQPAGGPQQAGQGRRLALHDTQLAGRLASGTQ